jgi:Ricin-type beta-trefoil lectin domain
MRYLIVHEGNYCLGVISAASGAPVLLLRAGQGNLNVQWEMDRESGLITLAGQPQLAMAYSGAEPIPDKTKIVLKSKNEGEASQKWDWEKYSPAIVNVGTPNLAIQTKDKKSLERGEIVLGKYIDGEAKQHWQVTLVSTVEKREVQENESVSAQ